MEVEMEKFNKKKGVTGVGGQLYEIKLVMLFLLEAIRRKELKKVKSFHLASNIEEGQSFDDLVFTHRYTDENGQEKSSIIFIQAKHKEKEEKKRSKISIETLLSTCENGDFILRKYICSFIKIRQQFSQSSDHSIFKGKLTDCEFIIFTNAVFDFERSKGNVYKECLDQEHFLNLTDKDYYYKLSGTEQVLNVLKLDLDFEILTKVLAQSFISKTIDMNKPVIKDYHNCLAETVFERINKREGVIRESFFDEQHIELRNAIFQELQKHSRFSGTPDDGLKNLLLKTRIQFPEQFGIASECDLKLSLPRKCVSSEDIEIFLNNLKLFTEQPNENDLTGIIKKKIQTIYRTEQNETDIIYSNVEYKVRTWWKEEDYYLTESNTFFQDTAKVSFYFEVKLPTKLFTGRTAELSKMHQSLQRNINQVTVISQMTTISGLGGIGKTELARQYIKEYGEYYDNNIIWINADNDNNLTASFLRLAKDKLRISIQNVDGDNKSIESVIEEVYQFFSHRKSLFVFDNVEDCNNFTKILPLYSLKPLDNRPYILITSRKREWEQGIDVIDLSVLTVKEAIELVKKGLDMYNLEDTEVEKLVITLQCFPLALRQAIAYIHDECIVDDYTIADYLEEFDINVKELLDSGLFQGIDNDYAKTTYTTWKITTNKISKNVCGHIALKLLNIIAFYSNENISRDMFLSLPDIKERQLKASVRLLIKYSMINGEQKQSILSVHKLVQEVTRLELNEQNRELEVIEESCVVLESYFPGGSEDMADLTKKRRLLPHVEMVLHHIDNKKIDNMHIQPLLNLLREGYFNFDPKNQKRVLERILKRSIEKHGIDTAETVETMIAISETDKMLGDIHSQKELLEQALKIQEKLFTFEHIETTDILTKLAFASGKLGNLEHKKELLEKILRIQENHFGPEHFQNADVLLNLGITYRLMGNVDKQKKLMQRAVKLEEQYEGPDNIGMIQTLANLSDGCVLLRDSNKQMQLLERIVALYEKYYASDSSVLATKLLNIGLLYGDLTKPLKEKDILERVLNLREQYYGVNHHELAEVLLKLSNVYLLLGDYTTQKDFLERALDIQEKYYGLDHTALLQTMINLAEAYANLNEPLKQKTVLDRVATIQNKNAGLNHQEVIDNLFSLANVSGSLQDRNKQKEYLERVLEIQQKHFDSNHIKIVATLEQLAIVSGILGDYGKQIELIEQAIQIQQKHYNSNHPVVVNSLVILSIAYCQSGNPTKQKEILERALEIQEHQDPPSVDIAVTLTFLALSHGRLGNFQKQKEFLERALEVQVNHLGMDNCNVVETLRDLSKTYFLMGDTAKQREFLEKAVDVCEKLYSPDDFEVSQLLASIGDFYGTLGEPNRQKELLEKALQVYENYSSNHFETSKILSNLGMAYGNLGEPLKQKELLERALELCEKQFGPYHSQVGKILTNLSHVYEKLGDSKSHINVLEKALQLCEKSYGHNHYETAVAFRNLGVAYSSLEEPVKQKDLLEKALELTEKHGGSKCEISKILLHLSVAYEKLGDSDKQENLLEKALENAQLYDGRNPIETVEEVLNIYEKYYGSNNLRLLKVLKVMFCAYVNTGEIQKELVCFERALHIQENHYGSDHIKLTAVLTGLETIYGELENFQKQKYFLERLLIVQEKNNSDDCQLVETIQKLIDACEKLGDSSRENELVGRIYEILENRTS